VSRVPLNHNNNNRKFDRLTVTGENNAGNEISYIFPWTVTLINVSGPALPPFMAGL
jgi:hypothetical protein